MKKNENLAKESNSFGLKAWEEDLNHFNKIFFLEIRVQKRSLKIII
jgi:hypothetical protein